MPNRYRLKGSSLEEIRRKAEQQYGPAARIVSAERVSSPGIAGLFAQDRFEAMIEVMPRHEVVTGEVVPDADVLPGPAATPVGGAAGSAHQLQGAAIAALLEEANAAELSLHRPAPAGVSTESRDFAEVMEQLGAGLRAPAGPAASVDPAAVDRAAVDPAAVEPAGSGTTAPIPAPLTGVGDLVVLVGLGEDAMDAALEMSTAAGGADVRTAGDLSAYGHLHVDGRQSATAARAHAVVTERTVLVAFGLGRARNALARVPSLAALNADQVWAVVDAGRKHEDTARWVGVLSAQLPVTAVAVVGASETGSAETVTGLGLPVGWIDGRRPRPDEWLNRPGSSDAPGGEG
ncbi:hypothetical protein [Arthrobacter sp. PM3]|uniref:hypothetical protein n=1 Tax=Arthrobacter sp. PM3 TaxID=2017685 RepID=UPI000E1057B1|nr:hypothetical protein [Arthrobacter sp. PM3]AXJ10034.1 hypothetical protein CFN17_10655 [Arthrobacter sp. PM3]